MFDLSEMMTKQGALSTWADKVVYNTELSSEEKEFSETVDAWAREIGRTGYDKDHELASLIEKSLTVDEIAAPSELISRMFNESSVGEFDDASFVQDPKNTIQVHEAIIGGNVDRSFINHKKFAPTWKSLQAETDISMQDLRRGGYRTVANLTNYIKEAFEYKRVALIMAALDEAIVAGGANYIAEAANIPSEASADTLALYLQDMTTGDKPFAFMLNKYRQAMSKLSQAQRWPTEVVKSMYNTDGFIQEYAGMELVGFSGQRKQPDGTLVLPDKRIFGVAGKVGEALTRGATRVLESEDINQERVHLKVAGYQFGYALTKLENVAKIVLA